MIIYKSVLSSLAIVLLVIFITGSQPVKAQSRNVFEVTSRALKDTTLAIIVDPKTKNSYYYKIAGKTIRKYDSRGTMVQSVKFGRRVTSRAINRHVKADAKNPSVVYLYPHPTGDGYIFDCGFFIRVFTDGIDVSGTDGPAVACRRALCKYFGCAVFNDCEGGQSAGDLRNDACAKCGKEQNCDEISIKPARVVSLRPNAGADPNQQATKTN